jgi:hypothetical protein
MLEASQYFRSKSKYYLCGTSYRCTVRSERIYNAEEIKQIVNGKLYQPPVSNVQKDIFRL